MEVTSNNVKNAMKFTDEVVTDYPDRLTGTESLKKSGKRILEEFESYCDKTYTHHFRHIPDGFLKFIKFIPPLFIIISSITFFKPEMIYISFILLIIISLMFYSQFVMYYDWFDFLSPEKDGENIYGVIEPEGEVKQQIIISGHYDAPYVFTYIEKFRSILYSPIIIIAIISLIISLITTGIWTIFLITGKSIPGYFYYLKYIIAGGNLFIIPLFWFTTKKVSPGAGDNMIAIAIASEIGKIIRHYKSEGKGLKHTKIMIMAFDAEEAGLNGARAYCKEFKEDLKKIKTYVYNIDSIYETKHLTLFDRDINGIVPLSKDMTKEAEDAANEMGYKVKIMAIPFGGGATDSGEFGRIGVESTVILAMATNALRMDLAYHTERDTIEAIDEDSVEACLKMILKYIENREEQVK